MSATVVKPEKLLKDLSGLWTQLGKAESEGSDRSAGVLRAVTMTFLLGIEEGADEVASNEALTQLMHEHPSRAIVLKLRADGSAELDGRAFAQCWMPFGRRQQICCEQIELSAGADHFEDVISLLRGLVAPDLPVVFWCRSARLFEHPSFQAIAAMSDKVIVDSRSHRDPKASVKRINEHIHNGALYGDLTWTRMTRWRETVSNLFERMDCRGFFESLNKIVIEYAHEPEPLAAIYLKAWFQSVLGKSVPVECRLNASDECWQIRAIRFETALIDVVIARAEKGIVETRIREFSTRTVFEVLDEPRLVREELAILGKDPIFNRVVEIASQS